ncbi:hypothetical protein GALL_410640 [mine drainage metagenome]|uniref:Uncharacterized protein n=1 Tax=mine drainage metagenome TaxID=410659 RepID=A0A1J5Q1T9_9ZZZZ
MRGGLVHVVALAQDLVRRRGGRDDRGGERVTRVLLDARRESQQLRGLHAVRAHDGDDLRGASCEGAGLVERGGPDPRETFERATVLDDDPVLGGAGHAGHEGDRRRDEQRARRRDNQHLGEPDALAGDRPRDPGDHERHEGERHRNPVGEPHERRLGLRGLPDQRDDRLVLGVGRRGRRPDTHPRGAVDGAGHQRVVAHVLDRHRLPGERRLVEGRSIGQQHAVDGDDLTRLDHQLVADRDRVDVDVLDGAVLGDPVRDARGTLEQGAQLTTRTARRIVLQGSTTGQHEDDDDGRPVLPDDHGRDDRRDGQDVDPPGPVPDVVDHAARLNGGDHEGVHAQQPPGHVGEPGDGDDPAEEPDQERRGDQRVGARGSTDAVHGVRFTASDAGAASKERLY